MRFFFLFLFFSGLYSQNLVLNPSFEDYKNCPASIGYISLDEEDNDVPYWLRPTGGTPDYFNDCSQIVGYKISMDTKKPEPEQDMLVFMGLPMAVTGNTFKEPSQNPWKKTVPIKSPFMLVLQNYLIEPLNILGSIF